MKLDPCEIPRSGIRSTHYYLDGHLHRITPIYSPDPQLPQISDFHEKAVYSGIGGIRIGSKWVKKRKPVQDDPMGYRRFMSDQFVKPVDYYLVNPRPAWWMNGAVRMIRLNGQDVTHARAVWLYHFGEWPSKRLIRIDPDAGDRIENLALTREQVVRPSVVKYRARVSIDGVSHFLGSFETREEARDAENQFREFARVVGIAGHLKNV